MLYGHDPTQMGIDVADTCKNIDLQQQLNERDLMQQLVHQHLLRAQNKMKHHVDQKRTFQEFSIGDSVYVKLQPYVQTSIAIRSSSKLAF